MSKFTYYIEFLINFLDAPIDELLENDLNEIRDYKVTASRSIFPQCCDLSCSQSILDFPLSQLLSSIRWESEICRMAGVEMKKGSLLS